MPHIKIFVKEEKFCKHENVPHNSNIQKIKFLGKKAWISKPRTFLTKINL